MFALGTDVDFVSLARLAHAQELCGCEAQSEYRVYPGIVEDGHRRDPSVPQVGHLLEESHCCLRFCLKDQRPFNMPLTVGVPVKEKGKKTVYGPTLVNFAKPFSFPLCASAPVGYLQFAGVPVPIESLDFPCCFCLPIVKAQDPATGSELGSTKYLCDQYLFVRHPCSPLSPFLPAHHISNKSCTCN